MPDINLLPHAPYTYDVYQSLLKQGSGSCGTLGVSARSFEDIVVSNIRENCLTESNVRDLVRPVDGRWLAWPGRFDSTGRLSRPNLRR